MEVDYKEALRLAKEKAEREADAMVGPGSGPFSRAAIIARLEAKYFREYTQP